jgi:hypothetical protein
MNRYSHIKTLKRADVIVVGGGPAGITAAISSARNGASTLLVEQYGCLGGMMTLGLVMPFGARASRRGLRFGGILEEILQETIRLSSQYADGQGREDRIFSSPHIIKYVLLDFAVKSGVDILFHAMLGGVEREGSRITRLVVATKSGLQAIEGQVFIDATGDGDVLAWAKEEFTLGSEPDVLSSLTRAGINAVHESDEHYGDYSGSGKMQPVSLMFTLGNVDEKRAMPFINKRLRYADLGLTREAFSKLPYANTPGFVVDANSDEVPLPQGRILFFEIRRPGEVVINMTRVTGINGADALDLSRAEVIAQQQMFYVLDFLKRFVPGFESACLLETGATLGVRETRRLVGQYVLSGSDAVACKPFADVIAHGSYTIDIHDPQGRRKAFGGEIQGDYYDIPWRCLLPKTIRNLLVAGRCISTDHVAHSSTRVQGTCMLTGQAAGTAAAMALADTLSPVDVDISGLQTRLLAAGVHLRIPQHTK